MKVEVFAVLKDYFDKEFLIKEAIKDIEQLKKYLSVNNPQAAQLLNICRFAVDDEFIDTDYIFKKDDHVSIIPPSSGG